MKYYQEQFFVLDGDSCESLDIEAGCQMQDQMSAAINNVCRQELRRIFPKLSTPTKAFVQENHNFHDTSILKISVYEGTVEIQLPEGIVSIADAIHVVINLDADCGNCWLYEEIVTPKQRELLQDGYFEFNLLTQNGELSCIGKNIKFTPSPTQESGI